MVAAISSALSALATLDLHIGQANVCAAATSKVAVAFNKKFAERLSLISPPIEDQRQQVNPKPVQKMPVESGRVNRDAAAHGRPRAAFTQHDIAERDQTSDQMRPVKPGENICEPAVLIFVDVETARDQVLPEDDLRG